MAVYKDEKQKTWYVSVRYSNWQGEKTRKVKRGFKTKKEAQEWEQSFLNENAGSLEMTFAEFVEIYKENQKHRVRESTWQTKESIIETKILPYFRRKRMIDIKSSDVVAWQNKIMSMKDETGQHYSLVYLKTIHNQLSAIFNHAVRYYDLPKNPALIAGNMGKEKAKEMLFWTKDEYLKFSEAVMDKPISFYAFEMLYWCGLRLGELLALTAGDFDFENKMVRINKSCQRINGVDIITDFVQRAMTVGPNTVEVIRRILASRKLEVQTYRMCQGVLGFTKKYSKQALEETCRQALELGKTTYTQIKNTIPVIANDLGVAGYNTAMNEERNKGAFVMGSEAMDINTLLTRSQTLAKSKGKGGGK